MLVLGSAAAADGVAAVVEVDARRRHDQHSIQVLMFVCPTVSELRFYGCCHPCFIF